MSRKSTFGTISQYKSGLEKWGAINFSTMTSDLKLFDLGMSPASLLDLNMYCESVINTMKSLLVADIVVMIDDKSNPDFNKCVEMLPSFEKQTKKILNDWEEVRNEIVTQFVQKFRERAAKDN